MNEEYVWSPWGIIGESRSTEKNFVPVPICPPQIPQRLD